VRDLQLRWLPATVLFLGAFCTVWTNPQQRLPLRQPLAATMPTDFGAYTNRSALMADAKRRATGGSHYLLRTCRARHTPAFRLYVGAFRLYVGDERPSDQVVRPRRIARPERLSTLALASGFRA
jgi:hypothetical protein